MIKVEKGKVEIKGMLLDLMADYTLITKKLKDLIPGNAEGVLKEAFRVGMLSEEEVSKEVEKLIEGWLEETE